MHKNYRVKITNAKLLFGSLMKGFGSEEVTWKISLTGEDGAEEGERPVLEGAVEDKPGTGKRDDFELVTISAFEDKNKTLPMARVKFDLVDKQGNEPVEKKALFLDRKGGVWVVTSDR